MTRPGNQIQGHRAQIPSALTTKPLSHRGEMRLYVIYNTDCLYNLGIVISIDREFVTFSFRIR